MGQRESTKKRPDREFKVVKPERKIESGVFDRATLLLLSRMVNKKVFQTVDFPISTGKEADVFRATRLNDENLAVKIFRIETSSFRKMEEYLQGDPRFGGISNNKFDIVNAWARKEFKNLKICELAGVRAPRPVISMGNVLVMEFLGENGVPFSTLDKTGSLQPEQDLQMLLEDVKKLYQAGLVHSDLSQYNVIMDDRGPYMIDLGQGVVLKHPRAEDFLRRDIGNLLKYFEKYGIERDLEEVISLVKEG
ncbi:serine protein kinase RIO [Candidatus Parvarchaeota archaeon]|nr:serine protein kinase RIO [Candidatus Parvarchaeota archaeon]